MGETAPRIYALSAWRETPLFTPRERAALAWTETLTLVALEQRVPDALFDTTHAHFSDAEIVDLAIGVVAINGWNRIAIPFALPPGNYKPAARAA